MRINARLAINLVVVLFLGVLTVGWVLIRLVGGGAFEERFQVTADFAASGGVFTNQEVTYRGVLIGRVGEMSLNEDGVNVSLDIEPEWEDRIPADVTASVQSKSAVGEQFVNLTPNDGAGPATLADGDRIPRGSTELPVDFQALLGSLDRVLDDLPPGRTRRLIQNLAGGLAGRSEEIATILRSLGSLSDAFASVAPEQQRLLDSATRSGAAFLATKDDFARAIAAADEVFAGIGDEPAELQRLLTTNDRLAREGIELLARRGDDLRRGIGALADLVDYQLREKTEVLKSLKYTPQFLKAVEEASIPWRSPDGREFYRIRVGLVSDNVESTWPCKYELPVEWERHAFEREARAVNTDMDCVELEDPETQNLEDAFFASIDGYLAEEAVSAAAARSGPVPAAAIGGSPMPTGASGLMWPLDGVVTSSFGPREGRLHEGIDIDGVTGEPVVASAEGAVTLAGPLDGYGNVVMVDHGGGIRTVYAHLSSFAVGVGDSVERGQVLGSVGCTGICFGDHLHFEVLISGVPVDPLLHLPGGALFVFPSTDLRLRVGERALEGLPAEV